MKNFKKFILTFACAFLVGMVNVSATTVLVDGETLSGSKTIGSGSITWDNSKNELTIDTINTDVNTSNAFIKIDGDAKIILKGENVINNSGSGTIIHGNNNDVTITGTGSLTSSASNYNIWVTGSLTIDGVKLDLSSSNNYYGALEADTLAITNDSNVKVVAKRTAIQAFNTLTIKNSEVYAEIASNSYGYNAINVNKIKGTGDLSIEGSKVTAKGVHTSIRTFGEVTVKSSTLNFDKAFYGLTSQNDNLITLGNIKVTDSNIVTTVSETALAGKTITIDNTLLNITNAYEIFNVNPTFSNMTGKTLLVSAKKSGLNATVVDLSKNENITTKRSAFLVNTTDTVSLTAESDDNSEVTIPSSVVVKNGKVTITISTKEGSELKSVLVNDVESISDVKNGKLSLILTKDTKIKVTAVKEYSVTATDDEGSTASVSSDVVEENKTVDVTITVNEGYKLNSVLVNDVESISEVKEGKLTLTITKDTVVKVSTVKTYKVSATSDDVSKASLSSSVVEENKTVDVTITVNEGYKLNSVLVNDVESISEVKEGKLTLTITKDTVVKVSTVKEEKTEIEVDTPTIDITKEVEEVTVGVEKDEVLTETLEKALETLELTIPVSDAKVSIDVNNQKEEDAPKEAVESIKAITEEKENLKIGSFFDITINVVDTTSNRNVGTITELSNEITFKIALPNELTKVEEGYTRNYYIVRYHDGKSEILNTKLDGNILTFSSDKFSTYAIAYEDVLTAETNPKTGDSSVVYILLTLISLIGLTSGSLLIKKN